MRSHATRLLLTIGAVSLLWFAGGLLARPLAAALPQADLLVAGRFRVAIAGLDMSSADVVSAEVDPIEIEMHDVTKSDDSIWRLFENGPVRFGEARFTFRVTDANFNKDLEEWVKNGEQV